MGDKPISKYEFDLTYMDVDELYAEHRRKVRSIVALEIDIDDMQSRVDALIEEIDNMISEKSTELAHVKAILAELIKREKASD